MLRLFNTFGKHIETFQPANGKVVTVFTCGPSVYQRSHIGNFRTFCLKTSWSGTWNTWAIRSNEG